MRKILLIKRNCQIFRRFWTGIVFLHAPKVFESLIFIPIHSHKHCVYLQLIHLNCTNTGIITMYCVVFNCFGNSKDLINGRVGGKTKNGNIFISILFDSLIIYVVQICDWFHLVWALTSWEYWLLIEYKLQQKS